MEFKPQSPIRSKIEDKDENCRLRHGLNVHCLAHIFQYLDSADLYTVGVMNEFYEQIINDVVIRKHEVDFNKLICRGIGIQKVFKKYGKNIRKFLFYDFFFLMEDLTHIINQHCSTHQLDSAVLMIFEKTVVNLPIHFKNVKKLKLKCKYHYGFQVQLTVKLSESLRYLNLNEVKLNPNFDWTDLGNLTELYLSRVSGINVQNFIKFLCLPSKLQIFHHNTYAFNDSTPNICKVVANCCSEIYEYSFERLRYVPEQIPNQKEHHLYDFISEMKNLKKVGITTFQYCGGDLIEAMKQLAENNTIEMLVINYNRFDEGDKRDVQCIFQKKTSFEAIHMNHFSYLKTLKLWAPFIRATSFEHGKVCDMFKFLGIYSSQILSNVENLSITSMRPQLDVIKSAPKLRHLSLDIFPLTVDEVDEILLILKGILSNRNNGNSGNDFIEISLNDQDQFEAFTTINGYNNSIKLSLKENKDSLLS